MLLHPDDILKYHVTSIINQQIWLKVMIFWLLHPVT